MDLGQFSAESIYGQATLVSYASRGIAIVLAIHGFHHGVGFLTTTQNVQHVKSNPRGLDFGG